MSSRRLLSTISRRQICALAAAALLCAGCDDKTTTVYVVRHAEKAKPGANVSAAEAKDPELTEAGKVRADALVAALGTTKLTAIFSSPYKRTLQTVAPVANAQGLDVQTVDAADVKALTAKLEALDAGSYALVSGHSNTVPMIIEALGVTEKVELGHDDHGDLFVVTTGERAQLERRRFGL